MENKRVYEDFEPYCKWKREEHQDILEVHLQGFKKEELKILVNKPGVLAISGEHPVDETKGVRFSKSIDMPEGYKSDDLNAKLSDGVLYVKIKKKVPSSTINPAETVTSGDGAVSVNKAPRTGLKDTPRTLVFAVVVVTIGTYVAYKIRQYFDHFEACTCCISRKCHSSWF